MSDTADVKLARLETKMENVSDQLERVLSHMDSEERTRINAHAVLHSRLDDFRELIVSRSEFDDLKKKWKPYKSGSGAQRDQSQFWS